MQPKEFKDLILLVYSGRQRVFHIESLDEALRNNLQSWREQRINDFVPVAAGTRKEVIDGMKSLWALEKDREAFSEQNVHDSSRRAA